MPENSVPSWSRKWERLRSNLGAGTMTRGRSSASTSMGIWNVSYFVRGMSTALPIGALCSNQIRHLLTRPVGRPPRKPIVRYHSFKYKAKSWKKAIRVVAKVVAHARYITFQMAEVAVSRRLYAAILKRIRRFSKPVLVPG